MTIKQTLFWLFLILALPGCFEAKQAENQTNQPKLEMSTPPKVEVNVPPAQTVDTEGLKRDIKAEIQTSSNATQNQLNGLVNTSVSKLGEKVVGLEMNLSELVKLTATMDTDIRAKVEASVSAMVELKTELKIVNTFNNEMKAEFKNSMRDFQASLTAKMDTTAQAVVGVGVKIDTVKNDISAGRDVNYLPKEAVAIIDGNNKTWMGIITGLLTLATTVIGMAYRSARAREINTNKLLMQAVGQLDPAKAKEFPI